MAPPIGTQPTAMMASVARKWRGADSALIATNIGDDAADAKPGEQPEPEHLLEGARVGGRQRENAKQQVRADQRRFATVTIAYPAEQRRPEQNADEARAEHRAERGRRNAPGSAPRRRSRRYRSRR